MNRLVRSSGSLVSFLTVGFVLTMLSPHLSLGQGMFHGEDVRTNLGNSKEAFDSC